MYYVRARVCAWDHPRSRGVYDCRDSGGKDRAGSSPLARGLPAVKIFDAGARRIIPARAGFTTAVLMSAWHDAGSSPLARGLRQIS